MLALNLASNWREKEKLTSSHQQKAHPLQVIKARHCALTHMSLTHIPV